jgi:hypothetical protein
VLDLQSNTTRALTPEGTYGIRVSPDGKLLLAADAQRHRWLYPMAGGEPRKLDLQTSGDERLMGFTADGKSLIVRSLSVPVKLSRIDIASGRREFWKEIVPPDLAGVQSIPSIKLSADGKAYAYSIARVLSDLYVVDGLK